MSYYKSKNTSKSYNRNSFSTISSSVAGDGANRHEGNVFEVETGKKGLRLLPYKISQGNLAKFFPGLKEGTSHGRIDTASGIFRDTAQGVVYVPIKKSDFLENHIGVGSHISSSFSASAYEQISRSMASKFASITNDTIFHYAVEEFYSSSGAASDYNVELNNTGPLTASFRLYESSSEADPTQSFSVIDNFHGDYGATDAKGIPDFEFSFDADNFITHWEFGTGASINRFSSSLFISSAYMRFQGGNSTEETASIVLTDNPFIDPPSGSLFLLGTRTNINGASTADGVYIDYQFKGRVAGDADTALGSGSEYNINTQFPGSIQVISYTRGTEAHVHSASFQYNKSSRNAATGSSIIRTLYYYSGSGTTSTKSHADFDFFTKSSGNGAPIHGDVYLRSNAPLGYYSPSGSQYSSSIFVNTGSGIANANGTSLGVTFAQDAQDG